MDLDKLKNATYKCLVAVAMMLVWVCIFMMFANESHACSRDPETLRPDVKAKYTVLKNQAAKEGVKIILICAERSQEDQDRLYAQGRTEPGKIVTWVKESKHTQGLAFDVAVKRDGGIDWDPESYRTLGQIGENLGLVWGGRWRVGDYGHFEVKR